MNEAQNDYISLKTKFYRQSEPILLKEAREIFRRKAKVSTCNQNVLVYIPTYNRGSQLVERALKSILGQSFKNFSVLIVNDCSTDDTVDLVEKIADPRVNLLSVPVRRYRYPETALNHWLVGPVHAANYALTYMSDNFDWIARIDDDEIWDPDHLEISISAAVEGNYEFISSANREVYPDRTVEVPGHHALSSYYYPELGQSDEDSVRIGCTSTWLYRSYLRFFKYNEDCWRKPHNKVNDIDLSIRMFEAGVKMGYTGRSTVSTIPRDGEIFVGSAAYLSNPKKTIEFYKDSGR